MSLHPSFLARPIAHRALHGAGRPENSGSAIRAAVAAGYGIEIDLQCASDGRAMVFHDYDLSRLTGGTGAVRARGSGELSRLPLLGGDGEGVPTFAEVLEEVAGRVPLLVEIKDQSCRLGAVDGTLERAAAADAAAYDGPIAFMSFNPASVEALSEALPDATIGLTTCAFEPEEWTLTPPGRLAALARIEDAERLGISFVSHDRTDLASPALSPLREAGLPILCWTIRSPAEEAEARQLADNVTFEGYAPG
ncbi:glycerophosphodiester phosphodiesterase family protein [Tropicimonas sp. IMCC34011]|uniref:glycerophosphodiester phosphodiesterase family protein n=1 Tax=Tropicimonas sp. IMCC34011 TaxID=2248759 RepID=UPI000E24E5C7|nr:glycerophosphodiester phosphodiesterase family protein [Tropicimonas sp. IMCC34011]